MEQQNQEMPVEMEKKEVKLTAAEKLARRQEEVLAEARAQELEWKLWYESKVAGTRK